MSEQRSERAEKVLAEADAAATQPDAKQEPQEDPSRALVQDISRLEESN